MKDTCDCYKRTMNMHCKARNNILNTALHIYSSSKIALILFFRNKMKSHMKISFFGFHLLKTHVQRSGNLTLDILFYKKEIEIKNASRPF